ncbi:MAG: hypothetical protein Q9227_007464 [Pyrenula ochraceoflavens]
MDGQEKYIDDYPFIAKLHLLGPGPSEKQYEEHYLRMRHWDMDAGLTQSMPSKFMFDSFWPITYRGLKTIMDDPSRRPDFIMGDFFVDAVKDMHVQYKTPIAMVWPQMPFWMLPCSYIPGQPGFQLDGTLTSEDASMWLRIKNELVVYKALPSILKLLSWTKSMRKKEGVKYKMPSPSKPDYLLFVNSFLGLEVPRDLPPTAMTVGPILSVEYPPLDVASEKFLSTHERVIYIALGTHVILSNNDVSKIVTAVFQLLDENVIDGVIWAVGKSSRRDMDPNHVFRDRQGQSYTLGHLLDGKNPNWQFPFYAPQRAILEHASVKIYFSHGGGSSANEALYHGKRMLCMGIFSDQIANTARLVYGGVAEPLNKFHFTSDEIHRKAKAIIEDKHGDYTRNSIRLQRIAHVASRRKHLAADLVEEVMYDNELRLKDGRELRPMHLQTADMRMPAYKAKNWDLMAVVTLGLAAATLSTGALGRLAWTHRAVFQDLVGSLKGMI